MDLQGQTAVKQPQPRPATTTRMHRIQERMRGRLYNAPGEPPTIAYSIVYFTTVAVLVALCVQAAFH